MNGSGFYKIEDVILLYAPTIVWNANYELKIQEKNTYVYPIDGWYWFSDENEARQFFGLPLIESDINTLE